MNHNNKHTAPARSFVTRTSVGSNYGDPARREVGYLTMGKRARHSYDDAGGSDFWVVVNYLDDTLFPSTHFSALCNYLKEIAVKINASDRSIVDPRDESGFPLSTTTHFIVSRAHTTMSIPADDRRNQFYRHVVDRDREHITYDVLDSVLSDIQRATHWASQYGGTESRHVMLMLVNPDGRDAAMISSLYRRGKPECLRIVILGESRIFREKVHADVVVDKLTLLRMNPLSDGGCGVMFKVAESNPTRTVLVFDFVAKIGAHGYIREQLAKIEPTATIDAKTLCKSHRFLIWSRNIVSAEKCEQMRTTLNTLIERVSTSPKHWFSGNLDTVDFCAIIRMARQTRVWPFVWLPRLVHSDCIVLLMSCSTARVGYTDLMHHLSDTLGVKIDGCFHVYEENSDVSRWVVTIVPDHNGQRHMQWLSANFRWDVTTGAYSTAFSANIRGNSVQVHVRVFLEHAQGVVAMVPTHVSDDEVIFRLSRHFSDDDAPPISLRVENISEREEAKALECARADKDCVIGDDTNHRTHRCVRLVFPPAYMNPSLETLRVSLLMHHPILRKNSVVMCRVPEGEEQVLDPEFRLHRSTTGRIIIGTRVLSPFARPDTRTLETNVRPHTESRDTQQYDRLASVSVPTAAALSVPRSATPDPMPGDIGSPRVPAGCAFDFLDDDECTS